jgi:hypothetical protein
MDKGLWIIFAISLFFWLFYVPHHRRQTRFNLVRIPVLARLAGSRDQNVNWRAFSIQLGFAIFFLSQLILSKLHVKNFVLYSGILTMISILAIQWLLESIYKANRSG